MNWKTETLVFVVAVVALSGHATASRGAESTDPSRFTYARLYCGSDGDTHFQDVTAELRTTNFAPPAPPIHIGSDFPARARLLRRIRHALGRPRPGKPPQPSHSRDSVRHRLAGQLFHHHD